MLYGWKTGNLNNYNAKWSSIQCKEVSAFLEKCMMPAEITRPVRGLEELANWKGTEYRTFLLYVSIVVVKKFFDDKKIFQHFSLYYCAIVVRMRQDQNARNYDVAEATLKDFLINFKKLYGIDHFTSNLHNLCHIVDDVRNFGPLDTFTAYPFESKLFCIKRLLRSGKSPLAQVARRMTEIQESDFENVMVKESITRLKNEIQTFDEIDGSFLSFLRAQNAKAFSQVLLPTFILRTDQDKNRWFLTKSFKIVCLEYVIQTSVNEPKIFLYGSALSKVCDYFDYPIKSSELNIHVSDCDREPPCFFSLSDVYCKMVKVDYNDEKSVFIPLIHTIKSIG